MKKQKKHEKDVDEKEPEKRKFEILIKEYFGIKMDLSNFVLKDNISGNGIEIISEEGLEGFVFVDENIDSKYEERLEDIERIYRNLGKKIMRKFVDYENKLAGFDWRIY